MIMMKSIYKGKAMNIYKGYDLDNLERKPIQEVAVLSRKVAVKGIVLLKNEDVLPFDKEKNYPFLVGHR